MIRNPKFCRFLRIPLVTLCCVALCCTLFLVDFHRRIGTKHKHLCLQSHGIVRSGEVHRVFTHVFFHKGPWHLLVTMIPMLILGSITERQIGSILFFLVLTACWLTSVALEVAMATMLYHVLHNLFHGCSLGFSGVVFGLIVVLTKVTEMKECGIGIFKVPFTVVPWFCLLIYYFGFHKGSVFLHIGGIFAGYAYSPSLEYYIVRMEEVEENIALRLDKYDAFSCCLPSPERLAEWENSDWMQFVVQTPCFVRFSKPNLPTHIPVSLRKDHFVINVNNGKNSGGSELANV